MFTGLVETTAVVRGLRPSGGGARLDLAVDLSDVELGESISISGACLTVAAVRSKAFEADVSAETLARSTLGELAPGAHVNIERASRLGARMGGHIVTGHVDGVGRIVRLEPGSQARRLVVQAPPQVQRYVAPKGSIAIDGVSLTVNELVSDGDLDHQGFEVMLVPHTLAHTTLHELRAGQPVNLEADILARYVVRQLQLAGRLVASAQGDDPAQPTAGDEAILQKLREGGFV